MLGFGLAISRIEGFVKLSITGNQAKAARDAKYAGGDLSFVQHLADSDLLKCFHFWLANKPQGQLPRKSSLIMSRIPARILRSLFLYEYTAEQRFKCRLAGTAIAEQFGNDPTNCYLDELIVPEAVSKRVSLFRSVLERQLPVVYGGRLADGENGWKPFKRLLLPMADETEASRFVFGMVLFPNLLSNTYTEEPQNFEFEVWAKPAELSGSESTQ